ncbi:transcriptional regulator [Teredinibacter purpureus]|uniref:transcriptional regulator n=1 Tax=Teredinibacter purpureus TaxID=2731756 RepID=UPI0005F80C02|nr:transcriptional regulator [Teredinibacter purpureus]
MKTPHEFLRTERMRQKLSLKATIYKIERRYTGEKPLRISASKLSRMENGLLEISTRILQPWMLALNVTANEVFYDGWDDQQTLLPPAQISPKHWELLIQLTDDGRQHIQIVLENFYQFCKDNDRLKKNH